MSASNFTARKPDYTLSALNKKTDQRGPVGVGWIQPDGSIRIKINEFVVLAGGPDIVVTLFKKTDEFVKKSSSRKKPEPTDDVIPLTESGDEPPAHEYF